MKIKRQIVEFLPEILLISVIYPSYQLWKALLAQNFSIFEILANFFALAAATITLLGARSILAVSCLDRIKVSKLVLHYALTAIRKSSHWAASSALRLTPQWPRLWSLFAFFLPKTVREKVWEPGVADLLESYADRKRFIGKWERGVINLALAIRTSILVVECLAQMVPDRVIRLFFWFLSK